MAEGINHRVRNLPDESVVNKIGRAERKATSYLAIAGAIEPPDPKELDATIDAVVAQAKANKFKPGFPTLDQLTSMCGGLIGLNSGDDRIVEVRLKQTTEGDTNLLEKSMIIYGSPMADGNLHNHRRAPLFVAGRAGGKLEGGLHLEAPDGTPMANAMLSLIHMLGMEDVESFGDSTDAFSLSLSTLVE